MKNYYFYDSPIGDLTLVSEEDKLIAVRYGKKFFNDELAVYNNIKSGNILHATQYWLKAYFNGEMPEISELNIAPCGNEFRKIVWELLCKIPYGSTSTYGDIAKQVARIMNKEKMSAQAVGGQ